MNRLQITFLALLFLFLSSPLARTQEKQDDAGQKKTADSVPTQEELDAKFREAFNNVNLVGRWRLSEGDKLGEESEELYSVQSVAKIGKELWLFNGVRVKYGGKDVTLPFPIPVKVLWAGDTPVISVTDMSLPGLGTYTARVMVYRGIYTGTWFASDHGGSMSGKIIKNETKAEKK